MKPERSPLLDYAIIGLLTLNLAVGAYGAFRPGAAAVANAATPSAAASPEIDEAQALQLAEKVLDRYNAKDNAGLYARFDSLARTQLGREQFDAQMEKLYSLIGQVDDFAYSSAVLAGSDNGRDYYHLNFKVRLSGGSFKNGDMRLTVTRRGEELSPVGLFINGSDQLQH